ncbi:MAG: twin-arginine translocation signal domain-containing protein [Pseudonocardiaceae bacterium]
MTSSDVERGGRLRGIGRRRFLTGLGVGAAGALTLSNVEALAEQVEGLVPTRPQIVGLAGCSSSRRSPTRSMLQLDKSSYLNTGFRPSLPNQAAGTFTMTDLLRWAKVDPASRGQ